MPIINGKRRYVTEAPAEESTVVQRYQPEAAQQPPVVIKRYSPIRTETSKPPKKRAADGGQSVTAIKTQEGTHDYLDSYEFDVRFNMVSVSFNKVSNIGNEIEVDTFVEGGNNDHPIIRRKARSKPDILVLEKGVTESVGGGVFALLKQGVRVTDVMIIVKRNKKIAKTYAIDEAVIVSRKFSDLDASSSRIYIEKLELAHNGISEVTP